MPRCRARKNVASQALRQGISTIVDFFGENLAKKITSKKGRANLVIANNVLAHVPKLNDFIKGLKVVLDQDGVISIEVPHLLSLIKSNQFDTIYHEHFSYFSVLALNKIFSHHDLRIFDVEQIATHGGSIRIYACHHNNKQRNNKPTVAEIIRQENNFKLDNVKTYTAFNAKIQNLKKELITLLKELKAKGKTVVGYGAPAKGNTLLNYCGITPDLLSFTVDKNPHKQGLFLPGTHIPIRKPKEIAKAQPDYILVLPWNLKKEIIRETNPMLTGGSKYIIPIPHIKIIEH